MFLTFYILILGATGEIGRLTAFQLSKRGARIILLCRNIDKAKKLRLNISQEPYPYKVDIIALDLASLESVRECADILLKTEDNIDILINNAGTAKYMLCSACF